MQLIGVSVAGLEAEFQPVVNYLLPHILSHKQDPHDTHLQVDYSCYHRAYDVIYLFCCYRVPF